MIVTPLIIPFLIWGAVALAGIFTVAGMAGFWDDPKKNKLGVLGMQQAGKTRFLRFLQNKPFIEGQTSRDSYEEFKYKLNDEKEIIISSGIDLGGETLYRGDYNKIMNQSNLILYFFDIDKYIKNPLENSEYYQRGCNSRFEHIYSFINKHNRDFEIANNNYSKIKNGNKEEKENLKKILQFLEAPKTIIIVATHRDKLKLSDSEMKRTFENLIQNKSYKELFKQITFVNLTSKTELQNLVNTIFNNK